MSSVPSVIGTATITVSAVFPFLALLAIFGRFRARAIAQQRLEFDDWWIVAAWIITLGLSICDWVFGSMAGINQLKGNLQTSLVLTTLCLWTQALILQVSLAVVKVSILFFYKRIFSVPLFRRIANSAICLTLVWAIAFVFLFVFETDPVSGSWTGKGRVKINLSRLAIAQAATSICLDLSILCLPLPFVFRLHMRMTRKLAVITIFWLGGFCCVAAILRLVFLCQAIYATDDIRSGHGYTGLHDDYTTAIFIVIEPNCSIIAACLPCYGPLLGGGRRLESIIASVRSVLSLRSRGSKTESEVGTANREAGEQADASIDRASTEYGIELGETSKSASEVTSGEPLPDGIQSLDRQEGVSTTIEIIRTFETRNEAAE